MKVGPEGVCAAWSPLGAFSHPLWLKPLPSLLELTSMDSFVRVRFPLTETRGGLAGLWTLNFKENNQEKTEILTA